MRLKKFDSEAISTIELVFHTIAFFPITIWSIGMALYKSPSIYCFGKRRGGGLSFDVQPNIVKFLLAPVAFISTLIASGFCLMPFLITWLLNTGTIVLWEVNVNLSKLVFCGIYFRVFSNEFPLTS